MEKVYFIGVGPGDPEPDNDKRSKDSKRGGCDNIRDRYA